MRGFAALLLLVATNAAAEPRVKIVEPKAHPAVSRDLVSVYAAKTFALDSLNRYPSAGSVTLTGNQTFTGDLDFSGDSDFTSTVQIYQTTTHSGTKWLGLAHDGTNAAFTLGAGDFTFTGGSVFISGNAKYFGEITGVGGASNYYMPLSTAQTPDTGMFLTGTTANSFILAEGADYNFDFAHAATTNPTLFIHSADQSTSEYVGLSVAQTGLVQIQSPQAGYYMGFHNDIAEAGTDLVVFTSATTQAFGAQVAYTISSTDGTDFQAKSGSIAFQAVNKAGTTTCTLPTTRDQDTEDGSSESESGAVTDLSYTWTLTAAANTCTLHIVLTATGTNVADITYNIQLMGNAGITVAAQ